MFLEIEEKILRYLSALYFFARYRGFDGISDMLTTAEVQDREVLLCP